MRRLGCPAVSNVERPGRGSAATWIGGGKTLTLRDLATWPWGSVGDRLEVGRKIAA